ncbi:hypothetical protein BKA93DRAFT_733268 [Sparassis latifolia]
MATVTHYIYSHYDPAQREALERATGQVPEAPPEPEIDPWQTESAFGAQRRALAPRFVPAIVSYDEINDMMSETSLGPATRAEQVNTNDVSGWYRSLTQQARSTSAPAVAVAVSSTVTSSTISPLASPAPATAARKSKKDWFISRALQSEPATTRSTPAPTLADILSREPPPLPSERRFAPPVFLALGPTNKGFAMLQRSGWSEGEPLGPGVLRRAVAKESETSRKAKAKKDRQERPIAVKKEEREVDVIDLTVSDSEREEAEEEEEVEGESLEDLSGTSYSTFSSHNPTALLTPLPTVLKSDRLGVGLKAKTVGPYKESKKRITHGAAALAAHIRANEEMRRTKKLMGRGTRGFARITKAEAESRQRLLASLKD